MAGREEGKNLIGVTGTIGSGKSRVCRFLARRMGVPYLDLDMICRSLLEQGQAGRQLLEVHLDSSFFLANGAIDRQKLRRAIFADADLRRTVDSLLHPLALEAMLREAARVGGAARTVLVEAPLLFEAQWRNYFDRVVVVYADPATCCRRIMERDRVTASDAAGCLAAQMAPAAKALLGDHVLDNSGSWFGTLLMMNHLAGILACLPRHR